LSSTPAFAFEADPEEEKNDWDVTQPQGELKTISIDTNETTWSNLSVS
jgi:hypothetical protein